MHVILHLSLLRSENPMIYEETFNPFVFKPNRNLIRGYSTTTNLVSFEMEEGVNGIYVNSLKHYLSKDLCILAILSKVNAGKPKSDWLLDV